MSRYVRQDELHTGFNFGSLGAQWSGVEWRRVIEESLASNSSVGAPTTWVTENHDCRRAASRYAVEQPLKGREMPTEEQVNVSIVVVFIQQNNCACADASLLCTQLGRRRSLASILAM